MPIQKPLTVPPAIDPAQPGDGYNSGTQPKPLSPAEPAPPQPQFFLDPT
jgi:hypothetical protein